MSKTIVMSYKLNISNISYKLNISNISDAFRLKSKLVRAINEKVNHNDEFFKSVLGIEFFFYKKYNIQ